MSKVVDFSFARPNPKDIKAKGYVGVMRYLSSNASKRISASEVKDLQANGLAIGLVWEDTAKAPLKGFLII